MYRVALLVFFVLVPIAEVYVIFQVVHLIGGWLTIALLLAGTLLGARILRREGRRVLQATFQGAGSPDRRLVDTVLVFAGGILLFTPGFITDVLGLMFVLPFTRPMVRWLGAAYVARRIHAAQGRSARAFMGFGGEQGTGAHEPPPPVVRGEVIKEDQGNGRR